MMMKRMDQRIKDRLLRAEEITKNVMVVEENKTYAIKSQFRDGKAHIVSLKPSIRRIRINGELILEAKEIAKISNCSYRHEEYTKKSKDLILKLSNIKSEIKNVYSCSCEDYKYNGLEICKHILAVKIVRNENIGDN
jgi:hypothetical protein